MATALNYFKSIATKEFFTNIAARKKEYVDFYDLYLMDKNQDGTLESTGINLDDFKVLDNADNFRELCYMKREFYLLMEIEKYTDEAPEKKSLYADIRTNQISLIIKNLESLELESGLEEYKSNILEKMRKFNMTLIKTYLPGKRPQESTIIPKIRWLGQKNVLGTLFYDLWKGQDSKLDCEGKLKKADIPPLIIVKLKKDLEEFLESNFTDENGSSFPPGSFSDYLYTPPKKKKIPRFPTRISLGFKK